MRNLYLGWFIVAATFVLGEDDLKRWSNSDIEVCERSGLFKLSPPPSTLKMPSPNFGQLF